MTFNLLCTLLESYEQHKNVLLRSCSKIWFLGYCSKEIVEGFLKNSCDINVEKLDTFCKW